MTRGTRALVASAMAPMRGPPIGVVPTSKTVCRARTRPCMRGSARTWTIAVVAVMKAMLLKPTKNTIGKVAATLGSKARTGDEHRQVGDGVEREAPSEAGGDHEQAGKGRAEDARSVDQSAVEGDGVGHVLLGHHLGDERAAHGVVEGEQAAAGQRGDVEGPE